MIYKTFQDLKLSALGLGAMRLPIIDGDDAKIDEAAAFEMVDYAMANGINYYDTAWDYHEGNSELVLGRALASYPRGSFYLADKFPGYDLANMGKVEEIFEQQLKKCGVEYFDFYLYHNVCETDIDQYLDPKYGIHDYLMEQKAKGRIKHLGFSLHGNMDVTKRFLDAYGDDMEFCQIQLNYLDWSFQNAKEKVSLLVEKNIPIWVMEPLRGGKLAVLPEKEAAALAAFRRDESVPGWAFRFLQTVNGVTVVLSGMSNFQQLGENIKTFETEDPLTQAEAQVLLSVSASLLEEKTLPCTACRYCTSHCPKELDIPELLALYNEHCYTGDGGYIAPMVVSSLPEEKRPSACIGCKSCEAVCPQKIKISEAMSDFAAKLKG